MHCAMAFAALSVVVGASAPYNYGLPLAGATHPVSYAIGACVYGVMNTCVPCKLDIGIGMVCKISLRGYAHGAYLARNIGDDPKANRQREQSR